MKHITQALAALSVYPGCVPVCAALSRCCSCWLPDSPPTPHHQHPSVPSIPLQYQHQPSIHLHPPPHTHTLQDACEDLAATEAEVGRLQGQVEALMSAGEMAGEAAAQLDELSAGLEVRAVQRLQATLVVLRQEPTKTEGRGGGAICGWQTVTSSRGPARKPPPSCQLCSQLSHLLPLASLCPSPQEKRGYVLETRGQQEAAFLQVLRCFVQVLAAGQGTDVGDAMHTGGWVGGGRLR